jgi:UDP-N-acetylmuramoylalanine--D-glutamate ligase
MANLTDSLNSKTSIQPGTHVLVVGLGQTGLAAIKYFKRCGARVSVSEATPESGITAEMLDLLMEQDIFLEAGGHTAELFRSVDFIFVSPGVPLNIEPLQDARSHSIPILGEMAVVAKHIQTPIVAVTGTNGKTTVTTLLGDIFKACGKKVFVGGNIGTPLLEYLCGPQDADVVVAEVSSFQLDTGGDTGGLQAKVALLLNITPDHLERYASFSAYASSKFRIFSAQGSNDFAILNFDDKEIMSRQELWPIGSTYFFGKNLTGYPGADIQGKSIRLSENFQQQDGGRKIEESYDLSGTSLDTSPNLENAAAAILAARLLGCSAQDIMQGVRQFKPLAHRMTLLAEIDGVKYYDDSKATNVGAVYCALTGLDGPVILIAGGRDKGGDYEMLNEPVQQKVKNMLLIGEAREKMARAFAAFTKVDILDSLEDAVNRAANLATPGDIVLLSPACASFDMFESYADRGDQFKESVYKIKGGAEYKNKSALIH